MNKIIIKNYLLSILILSFILFGFYLCFIGGYGSDEDTLPMLHVFEARLNDGKFISSRFTSYPIPEIGLGFLSYFFGSFAANSATFLFLLVGLILIFLSFKADFDYEKFKLFLILSLSSPILFFENLEPIDYSWAFLFFSIGAFFFSKKIFEIAVLAFGFAIGSRINFVIFILLFIYFFYLKENINFKKRSLIFLSSFIIGGLFYLPIWFDNSFDLSWITAARPTGQGISGLLARFTYKSIMTFGLIQFILIVYILFNTKLTNSQNIKVLITLSISNFALFLYIPAEKSYLQPAIIFLNLIIIENLNKIIIILLIIFNLISWIISYDFLKIEYIDNTKCAPKEAISASLEFSLNKGAISNFYKSRKMILCWVNKNSERGKRIIEGKSTRIK